MMEDAKHCGSNWVADSCGIQLSSKELLNLGSMNPTPAKVQTNFMDPMAVNYNKSIVRSCRCWQETYFTNRMSQLDLKSKICQSNTFKGFAIPMLYVSQDCDVNWLTWDLL